MNESKDHKRVFLESSLQYGYLTNFLYFIHSIHCMVQACTLVYPGVLCTLHFCPYYELIKPTTKTRNTFHQSPVHYGSREPPQSIWRKKIETWSNECIYDQICKATKCRLLLNLVNLFFCFSDKNPEIFEIIKTKFDLMSRAPIT